MAKDTKERLLEAALEIFARDGYTGTNLKDIAESVGIVKSALYRHFDSKEALWEAVKDMMADYYENHVGSRDKLLAIPQNTDELMKMTMRTIYFTVLIHFCDRNPDRENEAMEKMRNFIRQFIETYGNN